MSRDDCADPGDLWEQLEQCEADAEEFCQRIAALESLVRWLIGCGEVRAHRDGRPMVGFEHNSWFIPDELVDLVESLRGES